METWHYGACNAKTHEPIFECVKYKLYRKIIVEASVLDKKLYILKTDDERIKKAQEKIKAEYPDYEIKMFEGRKVKRKEP